MFLKLIGVFFSLWAPFILVMHQCRQLLLSNITYFQLVIGLLSSAFLAPDHLSNSYQFLRVLPSHDEWLIFLPYLCKKAQYGPLGTEIRAYYNPESVMINGLIFRVTLRLLLCVFRKKNSPHFSSYLDFNLIRRPWF